MSIARLRRTGAPVAVVTMVSFVLSYAPHRRAWAEEQVPPAQVAPAETALPHEALATVAATARGEHIATVTPAAAAPERTDAVAESKSRASAGMLPSPIVDAVATEGNVNGVSSQAISVPQGAGKIQGMGESFSTQMSTGIATFSVPFTLLKARGGAQPVLGLSYSSASGRGAAGIGWDVGVPFISRQTNHGLPTYDVPASDQWTTAAGVFVQDRFIFNGGQELVPICLVSGTSCSNRVSGEVMPSWASGWFYFRPRVEGSYLRFFWSPDYRTWRVQSKAGETMEIGAPLDGDARAGYVEVDPQNSSHIFRWNLSRQYDSQGNPNANPPAPVNVVKYLYLVDGGMSYLQHVYDTPPAGGSITDVTQFAHHTYLSYSASPDVNVSYRRGWPVTRDLRLTGVDVTSVPFLAPMPRHVVRRYYLSYDSTFVRVSQLTQVQMQGRCGTTETAGAAEAAELLSPTPSCPMLPPIAFGYQHVDPTNSFEGFETLNQTVETMANSPRHTLDETLADLFDINADGLPDLFVTAPGEYNYGTNDAVFFNGSGGIPNAFGAFVPMTVTGVPSETTTDITLNNIDLAAFDIDGDGIINLVHMPQVRTYSIYSPSLLSTGWAWVGTSVTTASQQSPKINFEHDAGTLPTTRVMDVDGDGLVDVVFSAGTEYQTFFAGGLYPEGNGQFGTASWTSATSSIIGNDPVTSCLPWSATPALFSDPDVRIADMNGDGLPDIVRARPGDVRYWPGRGNGFWGTSGDPTSCPGGAFGQNQDIAMTASPNFGVVDTTEALLLDDVNGDGLDDLVKIEFNDALVNLNINGSSWSDTFTIHNTPPLTISGDRARLTDINGSGTRDLFWGNGSNYQYIDLQGGQRPWVLTHVDNGLGKTTDLTYSTSTAQMLAAEAAGNAWASKAPMPVHVVSSISESDNLTVAGRGPTAYVTNYTYRDAVYDSNQREFRGFRSATMRRIGDANSPSSTTSSEFLLGECKDDEPPPAGVSSRCTFDGRWTDNVREALKGLPAVVEIFDDNGVYLSTAHHQYTLRKLYTGLDGREVRAAFENEADVWAYDDSVFAPSPSAPGLADVVLDLVVGPDSSTPLPLSVRASAGMAHTQRSTAVDLFGNVTAETSSGCIGGTACPTPDDRIVTTTVSALVSGDSGGWLWRANEQFVQGANDPAPRNHTYTDHDSNGNAVHSSAELSGTLLLDRFHESSEAAIAPPPSGASVDGRIDSSWQRYDANGNITDAAAPGGRCRHFTYASDYADVPIEDVVFVSAASGACGAGPGTAGGTSLKVYAGYDRGLGVLVSMIDVRGEPSSVGYDGLGRLASITKPSALGPTLSARPSVMLSYDLASASRPYSIVLTQSQDGATESDASYRKSYAYVDGFTRPVATMSEADPSAGDAAPWILSGVAVRDAMGAVEREYLASFWTGQDPTTYPIAQPPTSAFKGQRYDAFGRQLQSFALDGTITLQSVYHALGVDMWDAADLQPGPHQGTFASTGKDGHGRTTSTTERIHAGAQLEVRQTLTQFMSTGEPVVITRIRGADQVVRWLRYDSLGRMVANVEPDTTTGFSASPSTDIATMHAWRYAYDDSGDLVGTSDARGCGSNYLYDSGGRAVLEDYSPCQANQPTYSSPDLVSGDGAEVFYIYDHSDPETATTFSDCSINGSLLLGRLASVSDRASRSVSGFDGRGRAVCAAKQIAVPGAPTVSRAQRYAPNWYTQTVAYDGADRRVQESTGATQIVGVGGSLVTTAYSQRGTIASVGSSYGTLIASCARDADDLMSSLVLGDIAQTTSSMAYDARRRLSTAQTYRASPSVWSQQPPAYAPPPDPAGSPSTFQRLLEDVSFSYDTVDDPIEIADWRDATEWPSGAKPVARKMQYDDLYRLSRVDYQYGNGVDPWVDPFDAEDTGGASQHDTRRALPSPHLSFTNRVLSQTFQYDWLGNTTQTTDDAGGFYDRSTGTIANGSPGAGPYQLLSATGGVAPRDGSLATRYDAAGNLVGLVVARNAGAPCLPAGASCLQRFVYGWDEVGRLSRATRWDGSNLGSTSDPLPSSTPAADLQYAYDSNDDRVLKSASDAGGAQQFTVYVFAGLELRGTTFDGTNYDRSTATEVPYLFAGGARVGRVHFATEDVPAFSSGTVHVLLELQDYAGSTAIVIDRATSELVEASTYQAYGAVDSDYRPERWDSFREDHRFTGKEEDIEVGLQYFGKRYYQPYLQRWVSADPLAIQSGGGDPNLYAYVRGQALKAVDPIGLQDIPVDVPKADKAQSFASEVMMRVALLAMKQANPNLEIVATTEVQGNVVTGPVQAAVGNFVVGIISAPDYLAHVGPPGLNPGRDDRAGGDFSIRENDLAAFRARWESYQFIPSSGYSDHVYTLSSKYLVIGSLAAPMLEGGGPVAAFSETRGSLGISGGLSELETLHETAANLSVQAQDIHGFLDNIAQNQRTTSALQTYEGDTLVGGGAKRDLSPAQRSAVRAGGDTPVKAPGVDAEVTTIIYVLENGQTPMALGTNRLICDECKAFIEATGGTVTSDYTAVWPRGGGSSGGGGAGESGSGGAGVQGGGSSGP